ncbi:Membrane-associating domain [Popillia japonica]|uniref:Membrane-associating domain n=1 Tax=Popillia japonica TaxID=7064 RepID=A0AAW1MHA2_POPJA
MAVGYVMQIPGILRILQLLFNFIGFVCILATGVSPKGDAFLAATIGGFLISLIIILIKILNVHERISLPWPRIEFIYNLVWAVFLLITSALVLDQGPGGYIAGGVFGLLGVIAYLIDALDKYYAGI